MMRRRWRVTWQVPPALKRLVSRAAAVFVGLAIAGLLALTGLTLYADRQMKLRCNDRGGFYVQHQCVHIEGLKVQQ